MPIPLGDTRKKLGRPPIPKDLQNYQWKRALAETALKAYAIRIGWEDLETPPPLNSVDLGIEMFIQGWDNGLASERIGKGGGRPKGSLNKDCHCRVCGEQATKRVQFDDPRIKALYYCAEHFKEACDTVQDFLCSDGETYIGSVENDAHEY